MKYLLFLLLPLLAAQCPQKQPPAAADHSPFAQLEMGPCFGFCPVYRLTFHNDGSMVYEGKRNVAKPGLDSVQISAAELAALREKVAAVNLWQYPDRIPTQVADAPYGTLTAWKGGQSKTVTGTIDRPEPLLELERMMVDIATAHEYQVREGVNPNRPPAKNRPELLVKFKPDANAGNVMGQITELDLRLLRRTGPENIWVVSYDPAQISAKDLIELVKSIDGVEEAQENAKSEERH
ncbi:MAG: hypothetical protein JNL02_03880 [Saprospiraceae bacterium]|nr:hypothetical protein [Saprospiraceae bacterium]